MQDSPALANAPADSSGQGSVLERIHQSLEILAARPLLLVALAFCLNALQLPYLNLMHDGRLYGLQTQNRATDGALSHDLFLRYGSQDQYTFFTAIAGYLAASVGLPTAFFLIYLLSKAMLFYGATRLFFKLFGATPAMALAIIILAVSPVKYGIFQVNEPYPTPRMMTCGVVLLGLTLLLEQRWGRAALAFLVALLLHPLMTLVGISLFLGWIVVSWWPQRGIHILLGLAIATLFLVGFPSLGNRLFGAMDPGWFDQVELVSPYMFPGCWMEGDWRRCVLVVTSLLVVGFTSRTSAPILSRFLLLTVLVGTAGLVATELGHQFRYKLLIQAQLYRMLWMAQLLAIPCAIQLVIWAWDSGNEGYRAIAICLAGMLFFFHKYPIYLVLPAGLFCVLAVAFRGLHLTPKRTDWLSRTILGSVLGGALLMCLWTSTTNSMALPGMMTRFEGNEIIHLIVSPLGVVFALGLCGLFLLTCSTLLRQSPQRIAIFALLFGLAVQTSAFAILRSNWYERNLTPFGRDVEFVRSVLPAHDSDTTLPTVYWAWIPIDRMYLQLQCSSYFEVQQLSGICFSQQTSAESFRRARIVAPFELARLRRVIDTYPPDAEGDFTQLFQKPLDTPNPTREDLLRLANEPGLEYVVSFDNLGPPYLATNGHVTVYDCNQLRALASRP